MLLEIAAANPGACQNAQHDQDAVPADRKRSELNQDRLYRWIHRMFLLLVTPARCRPTLLEVAKILQPAAQLGIISNDSGGCRCTGRRQRKPIQALLQQLDL